jgi:hypothetical protein
LGNFVSENLGKTWHARSCTLEAQSEEAKRVLEAELMNIDTGVKPKTFACSSSGECAVTVSATGHVHITTDYGKTWYLVETPKIPPKTGYLGVLLLEGPVPHPAPALWWRAVRVQSDSPRWAGLVDLDDEGRAGGSVDVNRGLDGWVHYPAGDATDGGSPTCCKLRQGSKTGRERLAH